MRKRWREIEKMASKGRRKKMAIIGKNGGRKITDEKIMPPKIAELILHYHLHKIKKYFNFRSSHMKMQNVYNLLVFAFVSTTGAHHLNKFYR